MRMTLGEACHFYSGTGFPEMYQGVPDGEFPFFKVGDISANVSEGNTYLERCSNYISADVVTAIHGTIIPPDTVVFAKIGEALKKNRRAITTRESLVDNNAMGIAPRKELLRIRYFYYFMCRLQMERFAEATAVPSVRKSRLEQICLDVPSFEKQMYIENVLDAVSSVIKIRQRQLRALDTLIKARFVEMFGMPGTDINGWGLTPLGTCCEMNPKKGSDSRLVAGLQVSFVPMPAVSENGSIDISEVRSYDEVKIGFTYFAENDVLFAKITPCMENGKGAVAVGLINGIGFGSTEFHVLRPIASKSNPYWLYTLMSFDSFRKDAAANMTGSAGQRRVPITYLERYKVALPPILLQEQFATFVSQVDKSKVISQFMVEKAA